MLEDPSYNEFLVIWPHPPDDKSPRSVSAHSIEPSRWEKTSEDQFMALAVTFGSGVCRSELVV